MNKVEIEIPEGKIANITKVNNDKVIIVFNDSLENFKTINSILKHLRDLATKEVDWAIELLNEYTRTRTDSYSEKIVLYRIIVAVLTNNERKHLTTGTYWYPTVEFTFSKLLDNCFCKQIIGEIEIDGERYKVVSNYALKNAHRGVGQYTDPSSSAERLPSFLAVSSKEIALHISKYFGELLFNIYFGDMNCDWKWVNNKTKIYNAI